MRPLPASPTTSLVCVAVDRVAGWREHCSGRPLIPHASLHRGWRSDTLLGLRVCVCARVACRFRYIRRAAHTHTHTHARELEAGRKEA